MMGLGGVIGLGGNTMCARITKSPVSRIAWVIGLGGVQRTSKLATETIACVSNSQIVLVRSQVAAITGETPATWNHSATSDNIQSKCRPEDIFRGNMFCSFRINQSAIVSILDSGSVSLNFYIQSSEWNIPGKRETFPDDLGNLLGRWLEGFGYMVYFLRRLHFTRYLVVMGVNQ